MDEAQLAAVARGMAAEMLRSLDAIQGTMLLTQGRMFDEGELIAAARLALDMIEKGEIK